MSIENSQCEHGIDRSTFCPDCNGSGNVEAAALSEADKIGDIACEFAEYGKVGELNIAITDIVKTALATQKSEMLAIDFEEELCANSMLMPDDREEAAKVIKEAIERIIK